MSIQQSMDSKLLQYAFLHGYKPISMAMFWWGASPKTEIRQHRNYYPACNGKCKPILEWMLKGLQTPLFGGKIVTSHKKEAERIKLETLYEDDYLAVVVKPSGLLSVPGKGDQPSVYSLLKTQWNDKSDVFIVHRLDMAHEEQGGLAGLISANNGATYIIAPVLSTSLYGWAPLSSFVLVIVLLVAGLALCLLHPLDEK